MHEHYTFRASVEFSEISLKTNPPASIYLVDLFDAYHLRSNHTVSLPPKLAGGNIGKACRLNTSSRF